MPRFRAKIQDLTFLQFLDLLPDHIHEWALNTGVDAGAEIILNEAKQNCPVLTGNLRRSLHREWGESTPMRVTATVGTDVEYAPFVEYGHMTRRALKHPDRQLEGRPRMVAPQPFLRPAYDEHKDEVQQAITEAFREFVSDELGKIGPRGGYRG